MEDSKTINLDHSGTIDISLHKENVFINCDDGLIAGEGSSCTVILSIDEAIALREFLNQLPLTNV